MRFFILNKRCKVQTIRNLNLSNVNNGKMGSVILFTEKLALVYEISNEENI